MNNCVFIFLFLCLLGGPVWAADTIKDGFYSDYDAKGRVIRTVEYRYGLPNGYFRTYYPDGRLKGWGGYFHYANSTRVFDRLNQYAAMRLQRWLWRKGGCQPALWATNPREVLRERYGLYRLPTRAAWTRVAA